MLVVLTVIDLEHKLLPNRIVYPTFVAGWVGLIAAALIEGDAGNLRSAMSQWEPSSSEASSS